MRSLPIPNRASWRRSASRTSGELYSSMRYWESVQTRSGPTPKLRFRRHGEAHAVDQVDARQRRCFYHHIGTVVAPQAELVVLPLHHVFIDQLIPSPGNRHSPRRTRGGRLGLPIWNRPSDIVCHKSPDRIQNAVCESSETRPHGNAILFALSRRCGRIPDDPGDFPG